MGAYAMNRIAADAHLPTPWLFEPVELYSTGFFLSTVHDGVLISFISYHIFI